MPYKVLNLVLCTAAGFASAASDSEPLLRQSAAANRHLILGELLSSLGNTVNGLFSAAQSGELASHLETAGAVAGSLVQEAVEIASQIQSGELPVPEGAAGNVITNVAGKLAGLNGLGNDSSGNNLKNAASVGRPLEGEDETEDTNHSDDAKTGTATVTTTTPSTSTSTGTDTPAATAVSLGGLVVPVLQPTAAAPQEEANEVTAILGLGSDSSREPSTVLPADEELFFSDDLQARLPQLLEELKRRLKGEEEEDEDNAELPPDDTLSVFEKVPLAKRSKPTAAPSATATKAASAADKRAARQAAREQRLAARESSKTVKQRTNEEDGFGVAPSETEYANIRSKEQREWQRKYGATTESPVAVEAPATTDSPTTKAAGRATTEPPAASTSTGANHAASTNGTVTEAVGGTAAESSAATTITANDTTTKA